MVPKDYLIWPDGWSAAATRRWNSVFQCIARARSRNLPVTQSPSILIFGRLGGDRPGGRKSPSVLANKFIAQRWQPFRFNRPPLVSILIISAFSGGCAGIHYQSRDGVEHHLIIGIGMVTTKKQNGVDVDDITYLGVVARNDGIACGFGRQHKIEIDPEKAGNLVLSVNATPLGMSVAGSTRPVPLVNSPARPNEAQ